MTSHHPKMRILSFILSLIGGLGGIALFVIGIVGYEIESKETGWAAAFAKLGLMGEILMAACAFFVCGGIALLLAVLSAPKEQRPASFMKWWWLTTAIIPVAIIIAVVSGSITKMNDTLQLVLMWIIFGLPAISLLSASILGIRTFKSYEHGAPNRIVLGLAMSLLIAAVAMGAALAAVSVAQL